MSFKKEITIESIVIKNNGVFSIDIKSQKFLKLFPRTIYTYIPDNNDSLPVIHSEILDLSRIKEGYGVFFTINGFAEGKRDSAHLVALNGLFCDIDYPDKINRDPDKIRIYKNDLVQELCNDDFLPTAIVETKNGLHVYWCFPAPIMLADYNEQQREKLLSNYRRVEEAILERFDGDPAAKDTSRVLRVPGTWHQKDPQDVFQVKMHFFAEENTYTFDHLASKFLKKPIEDTWAMAQTDTAIDEETKKEIEEKYPRLSRPSYQKLLSKTAVIQEGMRNRALLVVAAACCLAGWSIDKTYTQFDTFYGLSMREIRKTIQSAYRHPYDFGTKNEVMVALMQEEERAKLSQVSSSVVAKKFKAERDQSKDVQKKMYEMYELVIAERYPYLRYKINGDFYLYGNGFYSPLTTESVRSMYLREMAKDELVNYRKVSCVNDKIACFKSLHERTFKQDDENANANILNLENGLLDINTFELKPHTPDYLSTVRVPVKWVPEARAPLWFGFINDITDGDVEQGKLLQQIMGYCLTDDVSFQKAFIFLGFQGGNGKGVFTKMLSKIVGRENTSNINLSTLTRQFGLSGLIGKRLNIIDEISGNYFESDVVKRLISGQTMAAEVKYRPDPLEFTPIAKHIFTVNELPKINDTSQALYRRFIIVPFTRTFQGKPDTRLEEKLTAELPGILNWAIEGLKSLRIMNHFNETDKNHEALRKFKAENSPIVEFLTEFYESVPPDQMRKYLVRYTSLYKAYKEYCQENGYRSKALSNFSREIENLNYEGWKILKSRDRDGIFFYGLRPLRNVSGELIKYV